MTKQKVICVTHFLLATVCMMLCVSSCKTQMVEIEKPVVVEHTTTHHHTDIVRDTLMQRDSVYHYIQGDTTIIERWHNYYHTTHDTIHIDTTIIREVPVEVKVPVEVEKPLTRWEKAKQDVGGMAIGVALAAMIGAVVWGIYKARKLGEKG